MARHGEAGGKLPNVKKMSDHQLHYCLIIPIMPEMPDRLKLFLNQCHEEKFKRELKKVKKQNKSKK